MKAFARKLLLIVLAAGIVFVSGCGAGDFDLPDIHDTPVPGGNTAHDPVSEPAGDPAPAPAPDPADVPGYTAVDPSLVVTDRAWGEIMSLPTLSEILDYDRSSTQRSPYLVGWMDTDGVQNYADYFVDFKADFLPPYTYCCLGNFMLDYSSLYSRYTSIRQDYGTVSGYAGFQRGAADKRTNAIMSFWSVYCTDAAGNETVISAKLVYPAQETERPFDGEGSGVQYLPTYDWEAGHWYRMILHCDTSGTTGNTTVAQWVIDLESGEETLLCIYDLGVPGVSFLNSPCVFLENFMPETSGDVRTLECRNFAINDLNGFTHYLYKGVLLRDYDYPGSYRYGTDGESFYFITTGVPGKAGAPQDQEWLSLNR